MSEEDSNNAPTERANALTGMLANKSARAAGAAIALSIIGSALWDWLAKPGLSRVGRIAIDIMTFGSDYLRNAAYDSASLDPYPVTSLALLLVAASVPFGTVLFVLTRTSQRDRSAAERSRQRREHQRKLRGWRRRAQAKDPMLLPELKESLKESDARIRRLELQLRAFSVAILLSAIAPVGAVMALGQAVLIRRVFFADLAVCAPYVSDGERLSILGQFAAVRTKSDFTKVNERLQRIAKASGVKLRVVDLW